MITCRREAAWKWLVWWMPTAFQPTKVGTIPSHLAAMMQTNINVQTLLTEAILTENRDRVYHAAMMDPHTAAVLGIEEIYALVDDLIAAHGDWLPAWLRR